MHTLLPLGITPEMVMKMSLSHVTNVAGTGTCFNQYMQAYLWKACNVIRHANNIKISEWIMADTHIRLFILKAKHVVFVVVVSSPHQSSRLYMYSCVCVTLDQENGV